MAPQVKRTVKLITKQAILFVSPFPPHHHHRQCYFY